MDPIIVPTQAVCVGPHIVDVIRDLARHYTFYCEIDGSPYEVLGFGTAPDILIVFGTSTPTIDGHRAIEVLPDNFQYREQFCIYGVKAATTMASELAS